MTVLGPDWHYVRGDWSPLNNNNVVLAHADSELTTRVRRLIDRVTQRFRQRANYVEIGRS